jgi:hypothetical protein
VAENVGREITGGVRCKKNGSKDDNQILYIRRNRKIKTGNLGPLNISPQYDGKLIL